MGLAYVRGCFLLSLLSVKNNPAQKNKFKDLLVRLQTGFEWHYNTTIVDAWCAVQKPLIHLHNWTPKKEDVAIHPSLQDDGPEDEIPFLGFKMDDYPKAYWSEWA